MTAPLSRELQALVLKYAPVGRKVAAAAYRRCEGRIPLEDLQQAALLGQLKAARRWTPERGSFATYSRTWAYQEAQELLRQHEHLPLLDGVEEAYADPAPPLDEPAPPPASPPLTAALPEPHRSVARAWARGLSDRETCARLQLTCTQGRALLRVVRRDLRESLYWQDRPLPVQMILPLRSHFLRWCPTATRYLASPFTPKG